MSTLMKVMIQNVVASCLIPVSLALALEATGGLNRVYRGPPLEPLPVFPGCFKVLGTSLNHFCHSSED